MLYRVSLTGNHNRFSVPQLGYLGYQCLTLINLIGISATDLADCKEQNSRGFRDRPRSCRGTPLLAKRGPRVLHVAWARNVRIARPFWLRQPKHCDHLGRNASSLEISRVPD